MPPSLFHVFLIILSDQRYLKPVRRCREKNKRDEDFQKHWNLALDYVLKLSLELVRSGIEVGSERLLDPSASASGNTITIPRNSQYPLLHAEISEADLSLRHA